MRTKTRCTGWMAIGLAALVSAAGCSVKESTPPPVTGPSELGLSVKVTATPDVLNMDGVAQSQIVVEARNSNSQAVSGLGLRVELVYRNELRDDMGRLSTKTAVTGSDGRATLTYTAPNSPATGNSDSGGVIVSVVVTPTGNDYSNAIPRSADIRLVPQGSILPLPNRPIADFTYSPSAPVQGQTIQFDGTVSRDCPPDANDIADCPQNTPTIVDYTWDFGDSTRGSGARVSHRYDRTGTYTVTLTVTNQRNYQQTTSKFVAVLGSPDPTAAFAVSPSSPQVGQAVFVNASASKAASGREIVSYEWDWGDGGSFASGVTASHRYSRLGSFNITLTVTDDIGRKGVSTQSVAVGSAILPTAVIVVSPNSPLAGQTVNFDGGQSTAPTGRTIRSYEWSLGDGNTASGQRVDHRYNTAGTYVVILTITDDGGNRGTSSVSVTVAASTTQNPTASFTASPQPAAANQQITFDAAASTGQGGTGIAIYEWNFGDSTQNFQCPGVAPCSTDGRRISHAYAAAGTYTVTLTVTDNLSRRATVSRQVTVQ